MVETAATVVFLMTVVLLIYGALVLMGYEDR